jgi:hypothetical protein
MDAAERELFAAAFLGAVARPGGFEIDGLLAELGWDEALADDPQAAVSVLFEWQGRDGAATGALDRVLALELGSEGADVVLTALGSTSAPGRIEGDRLVVRGLGLGAWVEDAPILVAATDRDGVTTVHRCAAGGLVPRSVDGLDPRLGLLEVAGSLPLSDAPTVPGGEWVAALAAGHRALAHELVGASRAMLDLAREHALDRIQFGVPIASFQAVRHRLADSLVAIESAVALVDAAWEQADPVSASVAKAVAGRSALLVAKHCQQVLAGIGFTAEHPLHHHVRRTRVLDGLLGDARTLTRELGEQLLRTRTLPPLLPL